jgi:hypothetical protein
MDRTCDNKAIAAKQNQNRAINTCALSSKIRSFLSLSRAGNLSLLAKHLPLSSVVFNPPVELFQKSHRGFVCR